MSETECHLCKSQMWTLLRQCSASVLPDQRSIDPLAHEWLSPAETSGGICPDKHLPPAGSPGLTSLTNGGGGTPARSLTGAACGLTNAGQEEDVTTDVTSRCPHTSVRANLPILAHLPNPDLQLAPDPSDAF